MIPHTQVVLTLVFREFRLAKQTMTPTHQVVLTYLVPHQGLHKELDLVKLTIAHQTQVARQPERQLLLQQIHLRQFQQLRAQEKLTTVAQAHQEHRAQEKLTTVAQAHQAKAKVTIVAAVPLHPNKA
jgi:hypothetical protein